MLKGNSLRWCFNCHRWSPTKDELLQGLSCIQEEERERIFKFVFKKDFKLSLIGRLMLKRCISECLDLKYDQVKLIRSDKGKPVLDVNYQSSIQGLFDFNVSHDGDYCVLAADCLPKVGVDVTRVRDGTNRSTDDYFKTMERIFSPQEWQYIKSSNQESSEQNSLFRFHRLWALKESFVKAEAIGIGYELRRIRFNCPTPYLPTNQVVVDTQVYLDGKLLSNWIFEESMLDNKHIVSVALTNCELLKESRQLTNFKEKSFNDLIDPNVNIVVNEKFWDQYKVKEEKKC